MVTFIKDYEYPDGRIEDVVINSPSPGEKVQIQSAQEYLLKIITDKKGKIDPEKIKNLKWADYYAVYREGLK